MRKESCLFYKISTLYGKKPADPAQINNFLKAFPLSALLLGHKLFLDKPITEQEVLDTIKHLKSNTAPGRDGFPHEFYKIFKTELAQHFADVGNAVLYGNPIPLSWSNFNIILIQKPEKDPLNPASYRPIALLNSDAKILTKLLASRLQKIFALYIHPDQTGFIPNRQIGYNIRRTLNLISHCKIHKITLVALSIDLEKLLIRSI